MAINPPTVEAASSWEAAELLGGVPSAAQRAEAQNVDSQFSGFLLVDLWIILAACLDGTAVFRCYSGQWHGLP